MFSGFTSLCTTSPTVSMGDSLCYSQEQLQLLANFKSSGKFSEIRTFYVLHGKAKWALAQLPDLKNARVI